MNTTEMERIAAGVELFCEAWIARDDRPAVRIYLLRRCTRRKWRVIGRKFGLSRWGAEALGRRGKALVLDVLARGYDRDRMARDLAAIVPNLRRQVEGYWDGDAPRHPFVPARRSQ